MNPKVQAPSMNFDTKSPIKYDRKVLTYLLKYSRPFVKKAVLIFISMLVYSGTVVALPALVKIIIDDHVAEGNIRGLDLLAAVLLVLILAQFLSQYAHQRMLAFVGQQVLLKLRLDLFHHLQLLSMSFHDRNEVGKVMSRIQNDVRQLQGLLDLTVQTLADLISLIGIVAVMIWMDVWLAIITLLVVPPLVAVLLFWQRFARKSFLKVRQTMANVNSGLQENISGVRVTQSLNRERTNIREFSGVNHDNLDANLQATKYSAILKPSVELLMALALALVVVFGGKLVLSGAIQAGILVAFFLYIQRFFEPVQSLVGQYASLQQAMVAGTRIVELLEIQPEVSDIPKAKTLLRTKGHVRYENVGFNYSEKEPVLRNINLEIQPGHTLALVGPTGTGKTTIASLLMRLYDVDTGKISIDGQDIRNVTLDSLSHQISVVTQEPYLFSDTTVMDNIRYNNNKASEVDIFEASQAVGAHEFIEGLEKGYDTVLQERGSNLSIGQRQLITFARALVADPQILILDEATASIDTKTEAKIQHALRTILKRRTAIVIAHRLSTIKNADQIAVVENGRIAETGTHEELIKLGGIYADLQSY